MTRSVGVHEAKTHLSRLLEEVAQGEEIVITRRGEEVARLVPCGSKRSRREAFGMDRGLVVMHDDFDDPLPEDIQAALEGRGT